MSNNTHMPDVLNCLANLSSDEVFTSPKIVNEMLDLLPQELFENPETTFLDPCTKSGVFLREIAKRLLVGLENKLPDLQERINHIFTKQLFGIAITRLTSLLSRRSLYCSKTADGKYSICDCFNNNDGNVKFDNIKHTFENHKCKYCGVSDNVDTYVRDDSMETYAYQFIHTENPKELFNMKFDVIIGNPPYQLNDGGGTGASAIPLYDKFVLQAKKLRPRFLTMIIPSRWFTSGKGLDEFRKNMLHDDSLRIICDYPNAEDCFSGVKIEGGVCYFLWDRDNQGKCLVKNYDKNGINSEMTRDLLENGSEIFIRFNQAVQIYNKVVKLKEKTFDTIVSTRKPFGFSSNFNNFNIKNSNGPIKIYANKKVGYIPANLSIPYNQEAVMKYKVFISFAYGMGNVLQSQVINKPFIGEPNSVCTETYLLIGPFNNKNECENVISYMQTKFFRFMVSLIKNTQNGTKHVYQFVPMQDFSKPWTDKELYEKYDLSQDEINFIESMIKPMQ